jgi:hypothetical protein
MSIYYAVYRQCSTSSLKNDAVVDYDPQLNPQSSAFNPSHPFFHQMSTPTTHNPFHVWYNSNTGASGSPAVLPPHPSLRTNRVLTLQYVQLNPDVLNCTIVGPNNVPWLDVITPPNGNRTVFRNLSGPNIGALAYIIDWAGPSSVEINGERKAIAPWLGLSAGQKYAWYLSVIATYLPVPFSHQGMNVGGRPYTWVYRDNGHCVSCEVVIRESESC